MKINNKIKGLLIKWPKNKIQETKNDWKNNKMKWNKKNT